MNTTTNAAGRIDRLPTTRFIWTCLALISLGVFWDAYMLYSIGPLSAAFVKDAGQENLATQIPAALFLGTFTGAILMGRLADKIGRGKAFSLNLGMLAVGAAFAAFAPAGFVLLIAIFVTGIGTGAEIPLSVSYIQELSPSSRRGRMSSLMLAFGFVGGTFGGLAPWWLNQAENLPLEPFKLGLLIACVGSSITVILRTWVPESPRWLERVGQYDRAEASLQRIENGVERDLGHKLQAPPIALVSTPATPQTPKRSTLLLLSPRYLRRTLSAWIISISTGFGSYGFTTFVPVILAARGYDLVSAIGYTALIQTSYPIGTYLSSLVTDRIPRKWGMAAFFTLDVIFGIAFYFSNAPLFIVLFGFLTSMMIFMSGPLLHTYEVEIYPTDLRGRGAGISFGISRAGGFIAPMVAGVILAALGTTAAAPYLVLMAVGGWLVCALTAAFVAVNTKDESLEELEVMAVSTNG